MIFLLFNLITTAKHYLNRWLTVEAKVTSERMYLNWLFQTLAVPFARVCMNNLNKQKNIHIEERNAIFVVTAKSLYIMLFFWAMFVVFHHPNHTSIFGLSSGFCLKTKQSRPDVLLQSFFLSLIRGDPEMLPGQIRSVIPPAVSGSASRLNVPGPPQAEILNGIQLTWCVERGSAWSFSGIYKILTFVCIEGAQTHDVY